MGFFPFMFQTDLPHCLLLFVAAVVGEVCSGGPGSSLVSLGLLVLFLPLLLASPSLPFFTLTEAPCRFKSLVKAVLALIPGKSLAL